MLSSLKSENITFVPYELDVLCLELRAETLRHYNKACKEHQKKEPLFYLLIIIPLLFIFKNIFLNFWPKMLLKRMAQLQEMHGLYMYLYSVHQRV
jgi:hypothetical protein